MSWSTASKSSGTFLNYLKHGKDTVLRDMANLTFNSVAFSDGTLIKDVTFDQLSEQVWTRVTKNSATFTNESKH